MPVIRLDHIYHHKCFLGGSDGKESSCSAGYPDLIPGSGCSPGEGNDNPLQSSCLENPMDKEAWQATVHGVAKSRTRLSRCDRAAQILMSPLPPCVERLNIFIRKTDSEPLGSWLGGSQSPDASDVGDCVFPQHHCLLPRAVTLLGLPPSVHGCMGLPGALITIYLFGDLHSPEL